MDEDESGPTYVNRLDTSLGRERRESDEPGSVRERRKSDGPVHPMSMFTRHMDPFGNQVYPTNVHVPGIDSGNPGPEKTLNLSIIPRLRYVIRYGGPPDPVIGLSFKPDRKDVTLSVTRGWFRDPSPSLIETTFKTTVNSTAFDTCLNTESLVKPKTLTPFPSNQNQFNNEVRFSTSFRVSPPS